MNLKIKEIRFVSLKISQKNVLVIANVSHIEMAKPRTVMLWFFVPTENALVERCEPGLSQIKPNLSQTQALL
ncbi:hypothetical protein [Lapidilactobacillus bayanensis]|uniref:hypothetical protein n=1 Tax=Lapidilactobacillus bayanensis TaxID=2485998 RepID=UPI000F7A5ED9|nr:hypothetical protein [Lapidilactobacillus bayanensis]